jgi:hypothetical protein
VTVPSQRRRPPNPPLCKYPKCGRTFPTRNQIHSCSQYTLDDALAGKTSHTVELFRKIAAMVRRFGAVEIVPQKTRIALQVRKIFLGIRFLRDAIDRELALARRIEHLRFRQILSVSPRSHYHYLRVSSAAELDGHVRLWVREAYRSAQQLPSLPLGCSVCLCCGISFTRISARAHSTKNLTATGYAVLPVVTAAPARRANLASARFATIEAGLCTFLGATPV